MKRTLVQGIRGLLLALSLITTTAFAQDAGQQTGATAQSTAASSSPGVQSGWTTMHPAFISTTAQLQGPASASEPVSIAMSLKLPDKDLLDSYIVAQNTPGSPAYHQWLSSTESADIFGPTAAQTQAVADYLTQSGFTHVQIADNRLLVTADGTVARAQKAFNTQIGVYNQGGESGLANTTAIQVPARLTQISHVLGLDTVSKAHTHIMTASQPLTGLQPQAGSGKNGSYYPDEFATAYNTGGATAKNTTVAIIGYGDMTNPVKALLQMESERGITPVPTSIVYIPAGGSTDDSVQYEWDIDAQAIVGITGGVKELIFYSSLNEGLSGWLSAINRAVSDNTAKVINMSRTYSECASPQGWADSAFALGATQGQTFSVSTGDNGSYPCGTTATNTYGNTTKPTVGYPASSPYVIAIGGTTLTTGTNLAYVSESAWAYGGGGVSTYELAPSWQSSLPIPLGASTNNYRQLPDLAFDGDPSSPMNVYLIASSSFKAVPQTDWYPYGNGTSLSSPLFVGAWAILQSASGNNLGFAPPVIYSHINLLSQNGALHDVTTGDNNYYQAKVGYDNATGWGSLDIAKAKSLLVSLPYYTVTASAGTGGSISPTSTSVPSGTPALLMIKPNYGYVASSVSGSCGGQLADSNTFPWPSVFTTDPISADCDVNVTFSHTPFNKWLLEIIYVFTSIFC